MFKRAMKKLVRKDANTQKTLLREIKKFHHKGQGKAGAAFHEIPPTDFFPDISDPQSSILNPRPQVQC